MVEEEVVVVVGDKTKFVFYHLIINQTNTETLMKHSFKMIAEKTDRDLDRKLIP